MGIGSRLFLIIFISLGLGIFVSYIIAERDITDTFQKHIINELQNQASLLAEVVDEVDTIGDLIITGPTYTNVSDFRAILIL